MTTGQPPSPPQRKRHWARDSFFVAAGLTVLAVVLTATSHHSTGTGNPGAPAGGQHTVTYQVTGTGDADVTYGPAGSSFSGTVPMQVTRPLGTPEYYAINAQLQGGGQVTCVIGVDGKVVSQSTAQGGYNIAMCEISQDPFTGEWENTNG